MPHAVVFKVYGGPEQIELIEIPSEPPGPDEVVVAVRASALNPVDAKRASGARGADPALLPFRVGFEAAGVVTSLGADELVGADGGAISVGDEVIVFRVPGAHASELTVPAKDVLQKPPGLAFEEAAGLLLAATTAEHALQAIALGPGETVLVHSAGGSVGRATVQLARRRGARVIGTASERHHEELRALGAEPVVYGSGLLERIRALGGTVDAAVDTVGTDEAVEVSLQLLAEPFRLVTIAHAKAVADAGGQSIGSGNPEADAIRDAARPELVRLAGEGALRIPVTRVYSAAEARAAFEFLADGHAGGKVVLDWS